MKSSVSRMDFKYLFPRLYSNINSGKVIRLFTSSKIFDSNIIRRQNYNKFNNNLIICRNHKSIENSINLITLQKRYVVNDNSWAADKLRELGEKVEAEPELPLIEATEELLSKPSPRVLKLLDEILSLNMLEVNQLVSGIQVDINQYNKILINFLKNRQD